MSFRTLVEGVALRERGAPAIVTTSRTYDVASLIDLAGARAAAFVADPEAVVARGDDVASFAIDLLALDGRVRALLCLPRGERLRQEWTERLRVEALGPIADGERTRWLLGTSGTTGTPKLIAHDLATLTASTKFDVRKGERYRWGLLYDPARFAGLQVVLQALLGGGALVVPPTQDLTEAVRFMAANGVTALSATPTLWRNLLMSPAAGSLRLVQVTLGGEIADEAVLRALRRQWPEARIVHIYASTEAGVAFAVHDGRAGFPASYLNAGALSGVALEVDESGHLWIRRPDRLIDSGDLVRIEGDRVLFRGRASGAINVGGNKVSPEEIEAVLVEHEAVVSARVHGRPSSMMGNLVAADLELRSGADPTEVRTQILSLCRERLPRWQWPAVIRFVDRLEPGAAGKVSRKVPDGS
jgi:acyl-CoA synthetase (AMP-forming)/AMP-acid ligase II